MASFNIASVSSGDAVLDIQKDEEVLVVTHKAGPQTCKELNLILECENGSSSVKHYLGTTSKEAETRPKIQKVTRILREVEKNKVNYDPRLISIGPYHHGDPTLVLGQTLKIEFVQKFASYVKKTVGKSLKAYLQSEKFPMVARQARECYDGADSKLAEFNEEEFKCLMFLDGCFVVYFIHCILNNPSDFHIKNDLKAIMIMDLFLLENQLPYMILQALTNEFMEPSRENKKDDIQQFIEMQTKHQGIKGRWDCCSCLFKRRKEQTSPSAIEKEQTSPPPLHMLDFFRTELLDTVKTHQIFDGVLSNGWQSFRSVDELKTSGIKCVTSDESSENKIDFISRGPIARLFLPATIIDDSFKTKWLNLAAYEACPDFMNKGEITSFICFMDSLIDGPEDVKELRVQGVLQNFLGSDQQVADLFNELATDLAPNSDRYRYVRDLIQKHFNDKGWVWIAEAWNTHFSSPWTVIAFFAAVFIAFLTCVQTYYSIFSAPKDKKTT